MLSRTPPSVLPWSSYTTFSPLCYTPPSTPPCASCPHPRPLRLQVACRHSRSRSYAQHASHSSSTSHCGEADISWPDATYPHITPTPYQILSLRRGDVYTKHRFYALVKLYHPDRCQPSSPVSHLPHAVRLERYRLLVAAHTILADDEKRRAYDLWGHGWTGHPQRPPSDSPHAWTPERRHWPAGHDPMMNATWEDWDRWYRREYDGQGEDPRAMYMSNFTFVSVVSSLVALGLITQGTRANMLSSSVMEQRDKMHKEASIELARSKRATMSGDRNERIKTFLEHREAALAGEDAYQRILPPPETCAPDTVRKQ